MGILAMIVFVVWMFDSIHGRLQSRILGQELFMIREVDW